jgi:hypothetical protein
MVWPEVVVVGVSGWENLRETETGVEVCDLVGDLSKWLHLFYCSKYFFKTKKKQKKKQKTKTAASVFNATVESFFFFF